MNTQQLTPYNRHLIGEISKKYPSKETPSIVELLIRMGIIDERRCKILIIRDFVERRVKEGSGKVDAMCEAAEKFFCSYEFVRSCMYYYKEINFI